MERRTAYYSGTVQGVGFRYTVLQVAEGRAVAGFVRNLGDGRVELIAEGQAAELDSFLAAVAERMAEVIRRVDVQSGTATREFNGFEIRR